MFLSLSHVVLNVFALSSIFNDYLFVVHMFLFDLFVILVDMVEMNGKEVIMYEHDNDGRARRRKLCVE